MTTISVSENTLLLDEEKKNTDKQIESEQATTLVNEIDLSPEPFVDKPPLPSKVLIDPRHKHGLVWVQPPYEGKYYICDACMKRKSIIGGSFTCTACTFDLCFECAMSGPEKEEKEEEEEKEKEEEEEEEDFTYTKMIVVIRSDLGMSVGKTVAQACHAAVGCFKRAEKKKNSRDILFAWSMSGSPKISVEVKGDKPIIEICAKAESLHLPNYIVVDAGKTEIVAGSMTAIALMGEATVIDTITGHLPALGYNRSLKSTNRMKSKKKQQQQQQQQKKRKEPKKVHYGMSIENMIDYYIILKCS